MRSQDAGLGGLLEELRAELIGQCGGKLDAIQRAMVERASRLRLHLELYDERVASGATLNDAELRSYLSFNTAFTQVLQQLGERRSPPAVCSVERVIVDPKMAPSEAYRRLKDEPNLMTDTELEAERRRLAEMRKAAAGAVSDIPVAYEAAAPVGQSW